VQSLKDDVTNMLLMPFWAFGNSRKIVYQFVDSRVS